MVAINGGSYVEPSFFLYADLVTKAGLTLRDTEDWTPGMVCDMIFHQTNRREEQNKPKPPNQSVFDNF